ncbi:cytochrome c3 family protein [Pelagibacterium limicola]|uniref:cytochrome c3 family protein n=1 Tax=Pelagibacterium limicola TaxID=2791022 RepID=UPI0018AFF453|nr:cytochrome c3 family protein [Pelagibacterium limicola]
MRTSTIVIAGISAFLAFGPASGAYAQQSSPELTIVEKWLGSGHADRDSPSFTHWNAEGAIPQNCAVCHSGEGFREFYGLDGSPVGEIAHPIPTGGVIDCATCHEDGAEDIAAVSFPSGIEIATPGSVATCLTCHQGRQSGVNISRATDGMDDDTVNPELTFLNPHYAVAAATQFGSEVKGAYEYPGKDYMGRFAHVPAFSTCADCHDPHSLEVVAVTCVGCHQTDDVRAIRTSRGDYDGDGDTSTGIYLEIANLTARLSEAIEAYASEISGTPIVYADRFPYFFNAGTEMTPANRYNAWTPNLLRAAYNFQFISKDKGAYSHNPHYAIQVLHDSIESLANAGNLGIEIELGERP